MGKPRKVEVKKKGLPPEVIVINSLADAEALFDMEKYLIPYLQEEPFFTEISRYINKRSSLSIPTAGIAYNAKEDQFVMYYNPLFFMTLPDVQVFGVIKHELYHFVCRHLTDRRRDPARAHNIASDAAINSLIMKDEGDQRRGKNGELPLPGFAVIPGRRPDPLPDHVKARMTKEQIEYSEKMADFIAAWPPLETTEFYFDSLLEWQKKNPEPKGKECPIHGPNGKLAQKRKQQQSGGTPGGSGEKQEGSGSGGGGGKGEKGDEEQQGSGGKNNEGDNEDEHEHGEGCDHEHDDFSDDECTCGGYDSLDDHSGWDGIPDEQSEYVQSKAQNVVEKAVRVADERQNGWGTVPAHMREAIRKSISNIVNWREVLRHFVGQLVRGRKTTSMKKINRKYPYIHPGMKKGYTARLLVAIDESGSVPNGCVELFFAELMSLTRQVDIDIVSFDAACDPDEIVTWKRGQGMPIYRTRCGGTDFNAPTDVANDPKFRGRWDGIILLTDMMAPKPGPSRIQRAWGIAPGCPISFETEELVFKIEKGEGIKKGSWY